MKRTQTQTAPFPITETRDPEIAALAVAYHAIMSQPRVAWGRMVEYLHDRITYELDRTA